MYSENASSFDSKLFNRNAEVDVVDVDVVLVLVLFVYLDEYFLLLLLLFGECSVKLISVELEI
jgi:hypothetical protein